MERIFLEVISSGYIPYIIGTSDNNGCMQKGEPKVAFLRLRTDNGIEFEIIVPSEVLTKLIKAYPEKGSASKDKTLFDHLKANEDF